MGRVRKDNFFLLGISYKTAPVEIREKVTFDDTTSVDVLHGINDLHGVKECVLVSTCNRTEIYLIISDPPDIMRETVKNHILDISGTADNIADCFYDLAGEQVIEHLFKVVAGLDSMVLGEPQIFGQVKNAYSKACDIKCTGPALNRLFHHAFRAGKLIRSMTGIGEGTVSVSLAAVELAKNILGSLCNRSVILVGAGKTGEISAKRLIDAGIGRLYIANRTAKRAEELADVLGGETIPYDSIFTMSGEVDIIISSVSAKNPIITKESIASHVEKRQDENLLLIDLGVPRNIEMDVSDLSHVTLKNINDIEDMTLGNMDKRKVEAEKAKDLLLSEVEEYCAWVSEREVIPVIRDLHVRCENIRLDELEKMRNRVSEEAFENLDLITRRIVRKILHNPVIAMRATESGEERERLVKSIQELFIEDSDCTG